MNAYQKAFYSMFGDHPWLVPTTTHPSDDSGVALLSRHFESQDTVDEPEAMRKYGIGRLSARVFDLNNGIGLNLPANYPRFLKYTNKEDRP